MTETVAVLGAGGMMGFPIARNIARAGLQVRAWNRSAGKARPLADDGVHVGTTPRDTAHGAGIVITMLADEDAVIAAMDGPDGALAAMRDAARPTVTGGRQGGNGQQRVNGHRGANGDSGGAPQALWVQMSTIGEEATRRCAELAAGRGIGFVDAPVLGTRQPAEQGKLIVLESGPVEARGRLRPVFDAIGQRTIHAGEAGAGSRLKLVTNSWVQVVVEAAAETIALAEGLDVDPELFFKAIEGGTLDLPYLRMKGQAITSRDFTPAFRLSLAAKDAGLVKAAAQRHGLDLPLIDAIARRFAEGAREHGDEDISATYLASTPRP
jgi:3-hydroxyisobutyrate dehydrogenase